MTPSPKSLAEELRTLAEWVVSSEEVRPPYGSIADRLLALAARAEREENAVKAVRKTALEDAARACIGWPNRACSTGAMVDGYEMGQADCIERIRALNPEDSDAG